MVDFIDCDKSFLTVFKNVSGRLTRIRRNRLQVQGLVVKENVDVCHEAAEERFEIFVVRLSQWNVEALPHRQLRELEHFSLPAVHWGFYQSLGSLVSHTGVNPLLHGLQLNLSNLEPGEILDAVIYQQPNLSFNGKRTKHLHMITFSSSLLTYLSPSIISPSLLVTV